MRRVLLWLPIIALLIALTVFLADHPGRVELHWQGWRINTSLGVLVAAMAFLTLVTAVLIHLVRWVLRAPRLWARHRAERRRRDGYHALTQGMVAVAAGDAEEAAKHSRRADRLLAEPPLTLLLSAQAAQLKGDEQAAQRYFREMLERPETEFLGLRGLITQYLRAGDEPAALAHAERARALRPKTPWLLQSLYEMQARAGKWEEAIVTLAQAVKHGAVESSKGAQHRAMLVHAGGLAAEASGSSEDAAKMAREAHFLDPGLTAAAVRQAEFLRRAGKTKQAVKVLEAAWRANPHPGLVEEYRTLFPELLPAAFVKQVERLTKSRPDHLETHLALARASLGARLWGEARRHLAAAGAASETPPPEVARLMAALEEAQHGDLASAHRWLARAASGGGRESGHICEKCGATTPHWSLICPHCRSFGSLSWHHSTTPLLPALPSTLPAGQLPVKSGLGTDRQGG